MIFYLQVPTTLLYVVTYAKWEWCGRKKCDPKKIHPASTS